ncbi:MAG: hypothetical protein AAFQ79_13225 [Pseudomonadota bacterium]
MAPAYDLPEMFVGAFSAVRLLSPSSDLAALRAELQALAYRSKNRSDGEIDWSVEAPELTTAATFGMHELAARAQRLRTLERAKA